MKRILFLFAALILSFTAFADDVVVRTGQRVGAIKPMNCMNNGPIEKQFYNYNNQGFYKGAHIPYARTHDTSESMSNGGEHTVDISAIFPDFSKDVNDPASYDFKVTDSYLKSLLDVGTEVFYRLGQRIEWTVKKYNVVPPKDPKKWARICEHIIRHYNEGWADGFHWNIKYWEIWNEFDIGEPMWTGTNEAFYELYETTALHLKKCFPDLKIGGPAVANPKNGATAGFMKYAVAHKIPLDFFSWHIYTLDPKEMAKLSRYVRKMLDDYGYTETESILNEWNYMNFRSRYQDYAFARMSTHVGASFVMAAMQLMQDEDCDMLMYYCANPGARYNGLVDRMTAEPTRTYYPFYAWDKLSVLGTQVKTDLIYSGDEDEQGDLYATAAQGEDGRIAVVVTRFNDSSCKDWVKGIKIKVEGGNYTEAVGHITDNSHIYTEVPLTLKDNELTVYLKTDSFIVVELR